MNNKGQAVAEMAVFGSLILFLFGVLLSQMQSLTNQQYTQMETFRRALEKACNYRDPGANDGAGASVSFSRIENIRQADLSDNYKKGNFATESGRANIMWSVPKQDKDLRSASLTTYRINEDEKTWDYRNYVDKAHDSTDDNGKQRQKYWTFQVGGYAPSDSHTEFSQSTGKQEDTTGITTTDTSTLSDTEHRKIMYRIKEVDKDDDDYENIVKSGELWDVNQHLYRDSNGDYKFSENTPVDSQVIRGEQWHTGF